jgi:FKBP-type peptidyl-prolyl cis-trans isomerase FklB
MNLEISYALGVLLGNNLQSQIIAEDIDGAEFLEGFMAALNGQGLKIDAQSAGAMADRYIRQASQQKAFKAMEQEESFLTENGKRPEVVSRPSGLQYEILTEGTGRVPRAQNKVVAHYEGRLLSGKIFDSSYKRGQPATFPVGGLIQGWQEALQIMPVGSKWRLYIPSRLGYGAKGAGADIPGNAILVFDLELLSIV